MFILKQIGMKREFYEKILAGKENLDRDFDKYIIRGKRPKRALHFEENRLDKVLLTHAVEDRTARYSALTPYDNPRNDNNNNQRRGNNFNNNRNNGNEWSRRNRGGRQY